MKVTLLGTGTSGGVPMLGCTCEVCTSGDPRDERLRTSAFVETDEGVRILIDCGPDFRHQMLREGYDDLDAILITHEHRDHTGGLDDLRAINFVHRKSIPIYAAPRVIEVIRRQYDYVFVDPYPGAPRVEVIPIGNDPFEAAGATVTPVEAVHDELPVLGFRLGGFSYLTDASRIPPSGMDRLRESDVLILNALRLDPHPSHFTLEQALEIVRELEPARALFTHASHQLGLHADVESQLPDGVHLGYDGMKLYL